MILSTLVTSQLHFKFVQDFMDTLYCNNRDAVIHACDLCCHHIFTPMPVFQSNCASAIKRVLLYCSRLSILVLFHVYVCSLLLACTLQSTVLRAGVKTLYNNYVRNKDHYDAFKLYDLQTIFLLKVAKISVALFYSMDISTKNTR